MAYNEEIAHRIRQQISTLKGLDFSEKKMFGGLSFLLQGKMTVGVVKDDLAVRIMSHHIDEVLNEPFVRSMDFTKRPMKEFVFVEPKGCETEQQLTRWINFGIEHAQSKASK